MPLEWSPCLWQDHNALGMVIMPLESLTHIWHGHRAFDMISRLWHGHRAFGMVITPLAWSPCIWHGHHADMKICRELSRIFVNVSYDKSIIKFVICYDSEFKKL